MSITWDRFKSMALGVQRYFCHECKILSGIILSQFQYLYLMNYLVFNQLFCIYNKLLNLAHALKGNDVIRNVVHDTPWQDFGAMFYSCISW